MSSHSNHSQFIREIALRAERRFSDMIALNHQAIITQRKTGSLPDDLSDTAQYLRSRAVEAHDIASA